MFNGFSALLLIVSTITSLSEGVLIKQYTIKHKIGGFIFTALVSFFSMIFFVLTDKGDFNASTEVWVMGTIAGALYCTASFLTYISFSIGSYALSTLILSYSLIFSIGYGLLFLGEPATPLTYAGLVLILFSLFLTRAKREDRQEKNNNSILWILSISISLLSSGMYSVMQRYQQIKFNNESDNEFMIIALGFSALTLIIIGIIKDGKNLKYIFKHGGLYATFAGLSNGATNLLSLVLNLFLPISLTSPTRTGLKLLLSFIVSRLLFKESFMKRQIIGVVLGIIAVILLNIKI